MLGKKTKWSYCIGATGRDAAYALVSMYLMTYIQYTMKLSVAQFFVISAIIIACLIWDAINDPLMGIIIENCHFKAGKFRPWILAGAVLNSLVIIALFTIRPEGWGFVAFFGVFYLLWGMTYTMNDIAYWGMLPSLSSDAGERNSLVTIMSIFVCVGQFLVAGIVPMVIAGNAINAFRIIALIVALGFMAFQTLVFFGVTENERVDEEEKKLSLKDMFKIFIRNDQLVPMGIASFLFNIGSNLLTIFGVNFFYFEFGYSSSGDLILIFTVMYGLGTLVSQALFAFISKHFSRRKILLVSMIALSVLYVLFLGLKYVIPMNLVVLNIIGFLIFFFQGLFNLCVVVMLNNTIEYDELKFHERHDSVISAIRSFSVKLASAVNQGVVALVLVLSGIYAVSQDVSDLENQIARGEITSSDAMVKADEYINGVTGSQTLILRLGMVLIPLLSILAAFLIIWFKYTITEEKYKEITDILAGKKKPDEDVASETL